VRCPGSRELITRRSRVQIPPPLLREPAGNGGFLFGSGHAKGSAQASIGHQSWRSAPGRSRSAGRLRYLCSNPRRHALQTRSRYCRGRPPSAGASHPELCPVEHYTRSPMGRRVALIALALGVGLSGCGADRSTDRSQTGVELVGQSAADRRIASDLYNYVQRGCRRRPVKLCDVFETVEAKNGVLTITTNLKSSAASRRIATQICAVVQGSDVADFTEGHTVRGRGSTRLTTCPASLYGTTGPSTAPADAR
jgi:hypothetical protein